MININRILGVLNILSAGIIFGTVFTTMKYLAFIHILLLGIAFIFIFTIGYLNIIDYKGLEI